MCSWQRFCLILSGKSPLSLYISSVRSPDFPSDQAAPAAHSDGRSARLSSLPALPGPELLYGGFFFICLKLISVQFHLSPVTPNFPNSICGRYCFSSSVYFWELWKKTDDCSCMDWNVGLLLHLVVFMSVFVLVLCCFYYYVCVV